MLNTLKINCSYICLNKSILIVKFVKLTTLLSTNRISSKT